MSKKVLTSRTKKIIISISLVVALILSFGLGYFSSYLFADSSKRTLLEISYFVDKYALVYDSSTLDVLDYDSTYVINNNLLDSYAKYYTKEEIEEQRYKSQGNNAGLGVTMYGGTQPIIYKVYGNSPAFTAGLKKGDIITEINGVSTLGENNKYLKSVFDAELKKLDKDEKFSLSYLRDGQIYTVETKKDDYTVCYVYYYDNEVMYGFSSEDGATAQPYYIETSEMSDLPSDTAYISYSQFEGNSATQLRYALSYMKTRGRTKLIFDVRDNGGGYMPTLCDVACLLIDNRGFENTVVAYMEDKYGVVNNYSTNTTDFFDPFTEITVLANQNSASATECLIGAMLYYSSFGDYYNYSNYFSVNNLIIEKDAQGEARTFGKGIMQTTYNLVSGGAIKFTTAFVLQPDMQTCVQNCGIGTVLENRVYSYEAIPRAIEILKNAD